MRKTIRNKKGGDRRQGLGRSRKQSRKQSQIIRTGQMERTLKQKNKTLLELCNNNQMTLEDIDTIQKLIIDGANPNVRNNLKKTPLHLIMTIFQVRDILSAILLDGGADPNLQDSQGKTPLHIFTETYQEYPVNSQLRDVTNSTLTNLWYSGADVNVKDNKGKSAFAIACELEQIPLVTIFLQYVAVNVNTQDNEGITPLHEACKEHDPELGWNEDLVSILLENGADPNIQDNDGKTALSAACETRNIQSVELLLLYGANSRLLSPADYYNDPEIKSLFTEFQNQEDHRNFQKALNNQKNKGPPNYTLQANVPDAKGKPGVPSSLFSSVLGEKIKSFVK